jgi:hypothetical protein
MSTNAENNDENSDNLHFYQDEEEENTCTMCSS